MRTRSAPVGESHIPELSQQIGDGPCEMSPCLPSLNAVQCLAEFRIVSLVSGPHLALCREGSSKTLPFT